MLGTYPVLPGSSMVAKSIAVQIAWAVRPGQFRSSHSPSCHFCLRHDSGMQRQLRAGRSPTFGPSSLRCPEQRLERRSALYKSVRNAIFVRMDRSRRPIGRGLGSLLTVLTLCGSSACSGRAESVRAGDRPGDGDAATQQQAIQPLPTIVNQDLAETLVCAPDDELFETDHDHVVGTGYPTPGQALAAGLADEFPTAASAAIEVARNARYSRFEFVGLGAAFIVRNYRAPGDLTDRWLLERDAFCQDVGAQFHAG